MGKEYTNCQYFIGNNPDLISTNFSDNKNRHLITKDFKRLRSLINFCVRRREICDNNPVILYNQ